MSLIELFITAVALSMDAFAVAICKGLTLRERDVKKSLLTGTYFGGFQALMPVIGYILTSSFKERIMSVDHWVAFVLLALIGANMIKESREESCDIESSYFDFKTMVVLAIATSIDAMAVGITFAFLGVNIVYAAILIGITTFIISAFGVRIGTLFGIRFKSKAEFAGGVVLILLGTKILLQHLGIF